VKDQILEAIKVRSKRTGERLNRSRAESEVIEHLRAVRIADAYDVARRYPHQLSGGQNQRIMLAMALAEKPRLLIADEPTTALDVTTQAQVLGLLKEIVEKTKMSVMFITHDLAVAGSICDRIAVLYGGMLQEIGPSSSVLKTPKHPYTVGLIDSIPSKTKNEGELEAIRGYFTSEGIDRICAFAPRCPYSRTACRAGVPSLIRVGENEVRCINYGEKYDVSAVGGNPSGKANS
jgi:peptide/nickel transport system ATP-binding protein